MRNWKNWSAPLLTCLTVLALALLPLRLSLLRDAQLTGTVHTEALAEDSNFPAKPPELPVRLRLLAQYLEGPADTVTVILQELEGEALERAAAQAAEELAALVRAGILPAEVETYGDRLTGLRIYLRDQTSLSSAGFLGLSLYIRSNEHLELCLDMETGRLAALETKLWSAKQFDPDTASLGKAFLDRLGLTYTQIPNDSAYAAGFRLADGQTLYWVIWNRNTLRLLPQGDWETSPASQPADGSNAAVK